MEIKYDIHTLKNVSGEGGQKKYVSLQRQEPLTEDELEKRIEECCSLTRSDVKGVLIELRRLAVEQLQQGSRFYLPGLGWLSLTAGLSSAAQADGYKITGNDIYPRAIRFKPEDRFYKEVISHTRFVKAKLASESVAYTEDSLWSRVDEYITRNGFITCRAMQQEFGLSRYIANKWLTTFIAEGRLRKAGNPRNAIYLRAE